MALKIDDLGTVLEELFSIRAKSYSVGLMLKVPVGTLDTIYSQFVDPSDKLRETLKAWLKMASQQNWQTIVEALKTVGEPKLASDLETKYCTCQGTPALGQASGQAMQPREIEHLERQMQQPPPKQSRETVEQLIQKMNIHEGQQVNEAVKLATIQPSPIPPRQETAADKELIWLEHRPTLPWYDSSCMWNLRFRGSAATDGNSVFFSGYASRTVYHYSCFSMLWCPLPDLPHVNFTLVMVNEKLTCVGGFVREIGETKAINSLLSIDTGSFYGSAFYRKWSLHFPPMCIKRGLPAVAYNGRSLIVAGGAGDSLEPLDVVEIMDVNTQQWSIASSMPHPYIWATTAICGEKLYILGGLKTSEPYFPVRSVFACYIPELLKSCQTQPQAGPLFQSRSTVWKCVADAPYKLSSCATLLGRLVVLGGIGDKASTNVNIYNETDNTWQALEPMKRPRYRPLVASVHDNMMMVVGGAMTDTTVEMAHFMNP